MDARHRRLVAGLLLFTFVGLLNGSSVATKEPRLLGIVLVEQLDVKEEETANVTSEDFHHQEVSTVGYKVEEEIETSTQSVLQTTSLREINSVTPTMDLITIIWYVATLIALISFFVVMACADTNKCFEPKPPPVETPVPPTPAPSYRLFAPPSYESVIEKRPDSIFIIPVRNTRNSREQLAEDLEANLSDVMEPVVPSSNAQNESTENRNRPHSSETVLSVTT